MLVSVLFRFHTGSIKSRKKVIDLIELQCFDSILVRLKATTCGRVSVPKMIKFRFHTGSIKRPHQIANMFDLKVGFDSILVRLKVK